VKKISGFTLVELITVIIIIAVLAAIAVPMLRGNTKKAIRTEAKGALAHIRTAQRIYYAEYGKYFSASGWTLCTDIPGIKKRSSESAYDGDLDGTYFSEECYRFIDWPWPIYCLVWPGINSINKAPKKDDTEKALGTQFYIYIDVNGNIGEYPQ
jgi:prepilin-type N-terminal cleavage/methylation domain-containing protein